LGYKNKIISEIIYCFWQISGNKQLVRNPWIFDMSYKITNFTCERHDQNVQNHSYLWKLLMQSLCNILRRVQCGRRHIALPIRTCSQTLYRMKVIKVAVCPHFVISQCDISKQTNILYVSLALLASISKWRADIVFLQFDNPSIA
jgi:hypothetical protein